MIRDIPITADKFCQFYYCASASENSFDRKINRKMTHPRGAWVRVGRNMGASCNVKECPCSRMDLMGNEAVYWFIL